MPGPMVQAQVPSCVQCPWSDEIAGLSLQVWSAPCVQIGPGQLLWTSTSCAVSDSLAGAPASLGPKVSVTATLSCVGKTTPASPPTREIVPLTDVVAAATAPRDG